MEITNSVLFILLILILLLVSWLLGYFSRLRNWPGKKLAPDPDYFEGLNYLLNDEPDDAIDVFIDALEINSGTFDTHLALGKLLRRRGKVDRAISHYENLLEAQRFNSRQITDIKIQLVRCFISAGLLDRAEALLRELKFNNSSVRSEALSLSVMVYQIEKEWQQALDAATELLSMTPVQHRHDLLMQISHFYCELAEKSLQEHEPELAADLLKQAMKLFKGNIRVYILSARTEFESGMRQEAVNTLVRALRLEPMFFHELFPLLKSYLKEAGNDTLSRILADLEQDLSANTCYLAEVGRQKIETEDKASALAFLRQKIQAVPSLKLVELAMQVAGEEDQEGIMKACVEALDRYHNSKANYRCENCGFELKSLHWCCPGCNGWGMVRPVASVIPAKSE